MNNKLINIVQVSSLDGALHHVHGVVHLQHTPVLPGQAQHIIEEITVGPALILDIVDGVHDLGVGECGHRTFAYDRKIAKFAEKQILWRPPG